MSILFFICVCFLLLGAFVLGTIVVFDVYCSDRVEGIALGLAALGGFGIVILLLIRLFKDLL